METMEFARGDGNYHTFTIQASYWSAGGRLFYAAKPAFDDDSTDAAALIQGNWGDDKVSDVTINGVAYKRYNCYFPPAATSSIVGGGASSIDLLGEFQFVPASGPPITYPAKDEDKIPVKVYMDIKIKTVV